MYEQQEWKLVAMPFFKFFNVDDDRAKFEFDWFDFVCVIFDNFVSCVLRSCAEFSEKLDGMMVMLYHFKDDWNIATMGVIFLIFSFWNFFCNFVGCGWKQHCSEWRNSSRTLFVYFGRKAEFVALRFVFCVRTAVSKSKR